MTLVDLNTELRLMAAFIVEPEVLRAADAVELWDFTDPRIQAVFSAIRKLQAISGDVHNIDEIVGCILQLDRVRETHVAEQAGYAFIGIAMLDTPTYGGHAILWEHDMQWLRELAVRRREAA